MLEQEKSFSKPGSISTVAAHNAAQNMLESSQLHRVSSSRDANDKAINTGAISDDQSSISNASSVAKVDFQILNLLKEHRPISHQLKNEAITLHMSSRNADAQDRDGDCSAQVKDVKDAQSEQAVINSDARLLQNKALSGAVRAKLMEDIAAKKQLQSNELGDIPNEQKYASLDDRDAKLNKALIDALVHDSPLRASLLAADITSKNQIVNARAEDIRNEPVYSAADVRDQLLDKEINDALAGDPFLSASRRQEANLPIWTGEAQLSHAELLQHERRRLGLTADATAQQVQLAEEADINKQLNLPVWDTKEQRIEARKIQQARMKAS